MKTTSKLFLLIFGFIGVQSALLAQCGGNIDFSTDWSKKGPASAGTWTVSGGGSSVTQTINGAPTFYVSNQDYIDVKISGTIKVNTTNDDDWVGFVFGYKDPVTPADSPIQKYYLFDWKQANQTGATGECYTAAKEGFSLIKVDTSIDLTNACAMQPLYWGHESYPGFNVMDSTYGSAYGWSDNTTYHFTLTYTSKLIVIEINGDTIFNVPGCYEGGKFGFYNLSQDHVIYSNFSYQLIPNFDFPAGDACINQYTNFNAVNDACFTGGYVSPIVSWTWNMGDGTTIIDTNVTYAFSEPGTYPITLTVEDNTGCQTPITKNFVVKGLLAEQNDTIICPGSSTQVWCNLAEAGAMYQWFKDGNPITSPTIDDTVLNVNATGNYTVQISGTSTYLCNTTSNAVTVTVENESLNLTTSDSVVCSGANVNFNVNTVAGATYSWYKDGLLLTGESGTSYSSNQTGSYHTEILTANGCNFKSDTLTLNAGTTPSASITSGTTHFCPGASTTLNTTLSVGETVAWEMNSNPIAGETTDSLSVSSAGNYTAVITNADGCSATSNVISISIDPVPAASVTASEPNFCPDVDSVVLSANAITGATYAWLESGSPLAGANASNYTTLGTGDFQVIVTNSYGCSDTSAVKTLQAATVSNFNVTPGDTSFCSGNSVTLSVNPETGSSFVWYKNTISIGTGTSKNVSADGDYYSQITNSFGCVTYSDTTHISVLPLPTASISTGLSSICAGDSTLITAVLVPGASYEWFKGGVSLGAPQLNNNSIYATAIGAYKVVVTDACNKTSNTLNITQNNPPSAAGTVYGYTDFCAGESMNFHINNVSGATSYTWEIIPANAASIGSGQGNTAIIVNTTTQNFSVKVTPSNTCGNGTYSTLSVTLEDPFYCGPGAYFYANKTNICEGSVVTFTNASNVPNPVFTPQWNFGSGASPATAVGPGPFNVTYSTSGYKTVTLEYVDDFGNPFYSETKTNYINVSGSISTSNIAGNDTVTCGALGEAYSVTNTAGSSYQWTVPAGATIVSGQGTNNIIVNFSGTGGAISVQETNTAGCVGAIVNFNVTIDNDVNTSAITGNDNVNCGETGLAYSVTNTTGSSYQWTVPAGATIVSGQGTNAIVVNFAGTSGNVGVQETSSAGCTGNLIALAVTVNNGVNTSAIAGNSTVKCDAMNESYSVSNTAGSSYQWTVPTGASIVSGQGTNAIVVDFNSNMGTISVVETSAGGCVGGAVNIVVSCSHLGINENQTADIFKVYPNPASDNLHIEAAFDTPTTLVIYNTDGKLVIEQHIEKADIINVSISQLAKGMHFGKVVSGTTVHTFKFIKQ
jgi:hypothetical protein